MAKRYTDTNKYKKSFIKSLSLEYKLFWDYLYHECNHAGIWDVEIDVVEVRLNIKIDKEKALELFNKDKTRIIPIKNGHKWFIVEFIEFQYGTLNIENRVHKSVIDILKVESVYETLRGLQGATQGAKDKDKDKDMVKDKDKDKDIKKLFKSK